MAQDQNTSSQKGASFNRGLITDVNDSSIPEGAYTRARNATEYTVTGDLNTRSNEPSNLLCVQLPYPSIGTIHLYGDVWAIYLTDDINSEIGIFDDSECSYTPIKNSLGLAMNPTNCLGFNRKFLIKGVSKQNFDCTWQTYWDDGNAPTRTININTPAFVENCNTIDSCVICTPTTNLDCEALRLARFIKNPCISITRGYNGGNLPNGSYFVVIAYTLNDQRVTDYSTPSNIQSIFEHENLSGSLNITINSIDTEHFSEFELVIVRTINQQTSAKRIGIYSTRTNQIFIDQIAESLPDIPIELIPFRSPVYDKSEAVFETGVYMIRVAPTTKFDFNYQPLANRITTKWISVEYPSDYYRKGGNVTSYLRDEVYPFFIRWVYNTGDKSSSYHIPGRPATATDLSPAPANSDKLFSDETFRWQVYNTATGNTIPNVVLPDGGVIIGEGLMSYWQSTEIYPDKQPDIWNQSNPPAGPDTSHVDASGVSWSLLPGDVPVNLCGKPIRHHKMPDNLSVANVTEHFKNYGAAGIKIRVLGVKFDKIRAPRDNQGNLIPGIVGYEILRGSREGNKTVIAKGMINNMKTYSLSPSSKVGLYPNYPYNPINATAANPDPTLSPQDQSDKGGLGALRTPPLNFGNASKSVYTFHSPDTQFKNPFLSAKELKLYGEINGTVLGNFEQVQEHPKEKLLGDLSFLLAAMLGLASAALSIRGQRTRTFQAPESSTTSFIAPVIGGFDPGLITAPIALSAYLLATEPVSFTSNSLINVLAAAVGFDGADITTRLAGDAASLIPGLTGGITTESKDLSTFDYLGPVTKALTGLVTFGYYWTLGTDTALRLIESLVPYRQYAYRYRSHGFYDNFSAGNAIPGNIRRLITSANYLDNQFQDFGVNYRINNLYRGKAVAIEIDPTKATIAYPLGPDNTVQSISTAATLGTGSITITDPNKEFTTVTTTYYAALKVRIQNQYGQMTSIQEIPITCVFDSIDLITKEQILTDQATPSIFGGDTYVTRYTEKNTFFYFYDWLLGQPDGFELNYRLKYMVNFPRYWADFTKYETGEFLTAFLNFINPLSASFLQITPLLSSLPSGRADLDRIATVNPTLTAIFGALRFGLKDAYFYLFQSGVRDFFVESEINTELRDWGNIDAERHYDPYRYTDTAALFDPKIIKSGNFFKYDISLSISRLFINFISWGNQQPRDYSPIIAEKCFSYFPFRAIYSLPQNLENKKDYWRIFLANNYKDFKSKITAIKPINKNGALILFDTASPIEFQGVDTLQTSLGTKITIGDGGLFSQPLQSVSNADDSLEYGSCQNRLSILNTPFGLYYVSENQGKVFQLTQGLKDITFSGLKFWFKKYLPYFLTQDIPNYPHTDNPVIGIGCQSIYDNQLETIYFCKKDYKVRDQYKGLITYNSVSGSLQIATIVAGDLIITPVKLTDSQYFEDASWTVSYSPKANEGEGGWVSHHDWHPELLIPSKNNFMSIITNLATNKGEIWRHNNRTDSFCNYYGIDYPFELEYVTSTGTIVNTVRSLEYYLECYKYDLSGINKYQLLDFNFDLAIISNTEQTSGVLNLNINPKNDPIKRLSYPIINPTSIDILYAKEEQKYRFNTFWDITDDRGEFSAAQRVIWFNDANGYTRTLNPANLNYQKNSFERKKFRHYLNYVSLQRKVSGSIKMIVKVAITKLLESKR